MKYLEFMLFMLIPATVFFLGFTYVYNAEFALFIIPERLDYEQDNIARFAQFFSSMASGLICAFNKKEIKNQINS